MLIHVVDERKRDNCDYFVVHNGDRFVRGEHVQPIDDRGNDRKKPELNLYAIFGFGRLRSFFGYREYRDVCPNGKLHVYMLASLAVAMIGMIGLLILGVISLASPGIE